MPDADSYEADNDVYQDVIIPMSDSSYDPIMVEKQPHDDANNNASDDVSNIVNSDVSKNVNNDVGIAIRVASPSDDCQNHNDAGSLESTSTLVFRDVCVSFGKKDVLKNVSGIAKLGQILAILGPVGAGKTTLLNALSGLIRPKSGCITLNGQAVTRTIRRKVSYVRQTDVFYPHLTLKETLTFAALLRLPDTMPIQQKHRRIQDVVDVLELKKCFNTKIGNALVTGLSGGERKRASIACELLTNPRVLIIDEPTSGLDSALSLSLITNLTKFAQELKKTIVMTIHQPSSRIFQQFGNILLMTDGEVAYFGPGKKIIGFFASIGLHCTPHYNPADFLLDQLKSGRDTRDKIVQAAYALRETDDWPAELKDPQVIGVKALGLQVKSSAISNRLNKKETTSGHENAAYDDDHGCSIVAFKTLDSDSASSGIASSASIFLRQMTDVVDLHPDDKWQTSFLTQYIVLTRRTLLSRRSQYLSPTLMCQFLFISIFVGLEWFQTERKEETARDRLGILFFVCMNFSFSPMMHSVYAVVDDVFNRERSSGIYRLSAYYLAITTAEVPTLFCIVTVYCIIVYWMTGLMPAASNFIFFWLLLLLQAFAAQGVGMTAGVVIRDKSLAVILLQSFIIASALAGGFYNVHATDWFRWFKYMSFMTYIYSAYGQIEFVYGGPLLCRPPNSTAFPNPCANSTWLPGEVYLEAMGLNFCPIYGNVLILAGILIVSRITGYVVLRFFRRPLI